MSKITEQKNWTRLFLALFFSIGIAAFLFNSMIFDVQKAKGLGTDFHYNVISMSATIGGFLFTGVSILISAIDKERIKRLWDNDYLNNLHRAAIIGMISNIISIVSAFSLIIFEICDEIKERLLYIEICSIIVGIIFFSGVSNISYSS